MMKPPQVILSSLCALIVGIAASGCVTGQQQAKEDPAVAYARFKAEEHFFFSEHSSNETTNPLAVVQVSGVRIDGEEMNVHPESRFAYEVRVSMTNLFESFRSKNVFVTPVSAESPYRVLVDLAAKENTHIGTAATKAFFTGALTLGLFGNNLGSDYDYSVESTIVVTKGDGQTRQYRGSGEVTAKTKPKGGGAGGQQARIQATTISLRDAALQLAEDKEFYESN